MIGSKDPGVKPGSFGYVESMLGQSSSRDSKFEDTKGKPGLATAD